MSALGEQARTELAQLAYAYGTPPASGRLRSSPEDFRVDEVLGFEPDGDGEHVLLQVEKRNTNTDFLAKQITRLAGVRQVDVSYAGLKDRNAVTTQWFSIGLAGKPEPDWHALDSDDVRVLAAARHRRKLRRGALQGNRFRLIVREMDGDLAVLEERLRRVAEGGVPNYFGEQRFGRDGGNLLRADAMFAGRRERDRHKRGLYLSAARSFLFNRVLGRRVEQGTWNRILPGEVLNLDGRRAVFRAEPGDDTLAGRLAGGDIHPTGPLWGDGEPLVTDEVLALEQALAADYEPWLAGLAAARLEPERRSLRLPVRDLQWEQGSKSLELTFFLDAGAYATTVLRECIKGAG